MIRYRRQASRRSPKAWRNWAGALVKPDARNAGRSSRNLGSNQRDVSGGTGAHGERRSDKSYIHAFAFARTHAHRGDIMNMRSILILTGIAPLVWRLVQCLRRVLRRVIRSLGFGSLTLQNQNLVPPHLQGAKP